MAWAAILVLAAWYSLVLGIPIGTVIWLILNGALP